MTIEKSLQRLHWRISSDKSFKPNENDAQALNEIIEWVNSQKEKTLQENRLFAKLYVLYFGQLLGHYKDIQMAQKELHRSLSDKLLNHVEWFRMFFNQLTSENFNRSIGLSDKPWYFQSDEEKAREKEILQEHQEQFMKHINMWSIEKMSASLSNQITECINKFKNYD